jgi:hypothetical protein
MITNERPIVETKLTVKSNVNTIKRLLRKNIFFTLNFSENGFEDVFKWKWQLIFDICEGTKMKCHLFRMSFVDHYITNINH